MKKNIIILVLICCFSCENGKKQSPVFVAEDKVIEPIDSMVFYKVKSTEKVDFNKSPVDIKSLTLNNEKFWITSGMVDSKHLNEEFCDYKNYHLERTYYLSDKENDGSRNILKVYVKDDEHKWNRETSNEEFSKVLIRDASINLWNNIHVGMSIDSLEKLIYNEEYHKGYGVYKLYSKIFEASFYFEKNNIDSIRISRRCFSKRLPSLYSKYFKTNGLDSSYNIADQIEPNVFYADFNSDGRQDVVFLIKNSINNKKGLAFFHSLNDYHIVGCGEVTSALKVVNYDTFGIDNSKIAYESVNDSTSGDIIGYNKIELKHIALSMKETEGTSGLLTWNGEKYIYIHTGD
ncbi:hypothetical protein [Winogradskyella sp.]|uniref:hypothetical protein n=1 Tax=unclassified Winogradskyella TaxID=2615021 RepID=UPI001B077D04|nr:hypothetical protein [Winogradskyella sp.]MBO6881554.1 hypothetical protein [Winogradskyella sp.]